MIEFIIKYWVQFLLGVVAASITWFAKRFMALHKAKIEADRVKRYGELENKIVQKIEKEINKESLESRQADERMEKEISQLADNVNGLTIGVLSIQGREFRHQCRALLKEDHVISIDEYEQFEEDYEAYKALKGNHKGDALHDSVVEKFNTQVANK